MGEVNRHKQIIGNFLALSRCRFILFLVTFLISSQTIVVLQRNLRANSDSCFFPVYQEATRTKGTSNNKVAARRGRKQRSERPDTWSVGPCTRAGKIDTSRWFDQDINIQEWNFSVYLKVKYLYKYIWKSSSINFNIYDSFMNIQIQRSKGKFNMI